MQTMGTNRFFLWFSVLWILFILPSRTSGVGSTAQNDGVCMSQPCENGGTCMEFNDAFLCACPFGLSGKNCERNDSVTEDNVYACHSNPCMSGQCVSSDQQQFTCMCSPGWVGQLCDRDLDECATQPGICNPGLTCVNEEGSYSCEKDDVYACHSNPCVRGQCVSSNPQQFTCMCSPGWVGQLCDRDLDECATQPGICNPGLTCVNEEGSYSCEKDDVYACHSNPCVRGQCVSSDPQQFTCMCSTGWVGQLCDRDLDECATQPGICNPGLTCFNEEGSYSCKNLSCHANPCQNGGTCLQAEDGSTPICTCPDGFTGTHCETITEGTNVCNSHPCQNGGTCLTLDVDQSEFTCQCASGFSGRLCDIPLHIICLYDEETYHEEETRYVDCNACYCRRGSWFCTTKFCGTIHGAFKFRNSFETIKGQEDEFARLLEEDLLNVFNIPDSMLQDLRISPGSIKVDLNLVSLKAQYDVRTVSNDLEDMLSNANYSFVFQGEEFRVDPNSVFFDEVADVTLTPTDANTAAPINSMDMFIVVFAVAVGVVLLFVLLTCVAKVCIRRHNAKVKARQYKQGEAENLNNSHQVTTIQQNHLYAVIDNSSEAYDDPDDVSINMNGCEYHTYERPKQDLTPNISSQTTMEYKELEFCRDPSHPCCQLERDILDDVEV